MFSSSSPISHFDYFSPEGFSLLFFFSIISKIRYFRYFSIIFPRVASIIIFSLDDVAISWCACRKHFDTPIFYADYRLMLPFSSTCKLNFSIDEFFRFRGPIFIDAADAMQNFDGKHFFDYREIFLRWFSMLCHILCSSCFYFQP